MPTFNNNASASRTFKFENFVRLGGFNDEIYIREGGRLYPERPMFTVKSSVF